jgi:hypothetical protein
MAVTAGQRRSPAEYPHPIGRGKGRQVFAWPPSAATTTNERGLGLPLVQRSPAWSPDGRLIAFVSGHETPGAEEVYTVRTDLYGVTVARRTWAESYHGLPGWIRK